MAKRRVQWEVTRYYEATIDVDDDWTYDALYELETPEHEQDVDEDRYMLLEEEL